MATWREGSRWRDAVGRRGTEGPSERRSARVLTPVFLLPLLVHPLLHAATSAHIAARWAQRELPAPRGAHERFPRERHEPTEDEEGEVDTAREERSTKKRERKKEKKRKRGANGKKRRSGAAVTEEVEK